VDAVAAAAAEEEASVAAAAAAAERAATARAASEARAKWLAKKGLPKFKVLQRVVLRSGFTMASQRVRAEPLAPGSVVQALETRVNAKGVLRVRAA
jgi:uncharacterized membrane protein